MPFDPERKLPDGPAGELVPADRGTLTREMLTILLAFNRFSPDQIADTLGLPAATIRAMRSDPDVLEAIEMLTSLLPRPGAVNELLMSDAERNIRWMRGVREGRVDGQFLGNDDKTLRIRADMAKALLDRQVAKKVEIAPAPLREIDVTELQRKRMERLLLEAPAQAAETPGATPVAPTVMMDGEFDG